MKIISLRFTNLNSLQGEWFIDFNQAQFVDNGLFAITGPTGAGKTTILDAICVALYHQTPRLGLITSSNNEIMSRGTANCSAEVVFEINGVDYRAAWSMRRSRNKVDGKLQNAQCELAKVNVADKDETLTTRIDEKIKRIEDLSGLNFERFNKSMMLSQGKFAEFLNASENDRAELLEELTGTEIYSQISMQVHQGFSEAKQSLIAKKDKLSAYQLLDEETLKELRAKEKENQSHLKSLTQQIDVQQAYITWLDEYQKAKQNVDFAKQELSTLDIKDEAAQSDKATLKHAIQAQKLMPDWQSLMHLENKNQSVAAEIEDTQTKLDAQTQVLVKAQQDVKLYSTQLQTLEAQQKDQHSYIRKEVQVLEQKISVTQQEYSVNETALKDKQKLVSRLNQTLSDKQTAQLEIKEQLLSINNELSTEEEVLSLADKIPAWKVELKQAKSILAQKVESIEKRTQNHAQISGFEQSKAELLSQLDAKHTLINTLKSSSETLDKTISELLKRVGDNVSVEGVKEALAQVSGKINQLVGFTPLQARYLEVNERLLQNKRNQAHLTDTLSEERPLLEAAKFNLIEQQQALDDTKMLLTQEQQLAQYRALLKPGDACQLCGSTEHPGVDHALAHSSTLDTQAVNDRQKLLDAKIETLGSDINRYQQNASSIKAQLTSIEKSNKEDADLLVDLHKQWQLLFQRIGLSDVEAQAIKIDAKETLTTLESNNRAHQDFLQEIAKQLEQHTTEFGIQNQQLLEAKTQETLWRNEVDSITFACSRLAQENLSLDKKINECELSLDSLVNELKNSLTGCGYEPDQKASDANDFDFDAVISFLQSKETLIKAIQMAQNKQREQEKKLSELASPIAVIQSQLDENTRDLEALAAKDVLLNAQLEEDRAIRSNMLDGQSIEDYLNNMSAQENSAKLAFKSAQDTLQLAEIRMTEYKSTQKNLDKEKSLLEKQLLDASSRWQSMLAKSSFEDKDAFLNAYIEEEALLSLQASLDALDTARKTAGTRLNTWLESLEKTIKQFDKLPVLDDIDEMKVEAVVDTGEQQFVQAKAKLTQQKEEMLTAAGEIKNKLEHDQKTRKAQAQTLDEIQKYQIEFDELSLLNSLIGSAKGDSFRKFAQGLTLDHLVYLANQRLGQLHGRYELTRNNAQGLMLEVCDTWQADTKRNTKTLSGGESFLVSLALALGLSDLVSNKISIDSLFLDEGFGTLDGATLDIALNALEQLNASGKMIGVISHVEGMKERIPIQIKVSKESGAGISKLDDMYKAYSVVPVKTGT